MRIARLLAPCVIASLAVAASAAWALASIPRSAAVALAVAMNAIRQISWGTQGTRRARAVLGAVVLLAGVCLRTVPAFALTVTETDAATNSSPTGWTIPSASINLLSSATLTATPPSPQVWDTSNTWATLVDGSFGVPNTGGVTCVWVASNNTLTYAVIVYRLPAPAGGGVRRDSS